MPSDVVRHMIPGKDTQRGYCRDIHMKADVCIAGTHMVIKNVPVDRFRPITNSPLDSIYCLDNWVGCARTVINKLVLKYNFTESFYSFIQFLVFLLIVVGLRAEPNLN